MLPDPYPFRRLVYQRPTPADVLARSRAVAAFMQERRSVRQFSADPVPREVIENVLRAATSAPSGANQQPWTFCAISNPDLKRRIREAAEEEERTFYHDRAPDEWLRTLAPLGTDWHKPFLETAPWLIVVFEQRYGRHPDGTRFKHFYAADSTCIATGFLLSAIHNVGLAALTHTPAPMMFLRDLLQRPENESPLALIPVGYPAPNAEIPHIFRKPLDETAVWFE